MTNADDCRDSLVASEAAVTTLAILGESGVGVLSSLEARSIVADEKCEKRKEEEEEIAVDFEDD
ncbi:hypothetical protein BY996DRAFT_6459796 [Phakopsora pachyrhizi]|nr:hypothetical protein BY996DRAFT_6541024 [Phakopsora pachyrhizi]KAI8445569.1 hypothetical protein BY996DRAFT_6596684 [Phakopsora pachyrhizi]KAI8445638.1 hypothetical protein BY996DRAFT_6440813 [Phakopsora pachyrhizi]KAI8445665.1 hypothetical protein BY996DRAFT_6618269 [Phakopsora pachyrhizi]KAI8447771.1 hypothetical protein BY996DRAFT_6608743 [Phakopsora pachyrhizi]